MSEVYPIPPIIDEKKGQRYFKKPKPNFKCIYCGRTIVKKEELFCSVECDNKYKILFPSWETIRNKIFARDNYKCKSCGRIAIISELEVDHIVAIALGGNFWYENNLQTLCDDCHKEKTYQDLQKIKLSKNKIQKKSKTRKRKSNLTEFIK